MTRILTKGAKSRRKWRHDKIAQGLCVGCGRVPSLDASHLCQGCKERQKDWGKASRARRTKAGLCLRCGREPHVVQGTMCASCLMAHRLEDLRQAGLPDCEVIKALDALRTFTGHCAACGRAECGGWCFDHDHLHCTFRAIIGQHCNRALGLAQDSPQRLRALADYLERYNPAYSVPTG